MNERDNLSNTVGRAIKAVFGGILLTLAVIALRNIFGH